MNPAGYILVSGILPFLAQIDLLPFQGQIELIDLGSKSSGSNVFIWLPFRDLVQALHSVVTRIK